MGYSTLVLSGGGSKILILLGALIELHHKQLLLDIKHYYGTSAGAILSYLLCLGFTPKEIVERIIDENLIGRLSNFKVSNFLTNKYIVNLDPLSDFLYELSMQKRGAIPTLGELDQDLTIVAYNLSTHTLTHFHKSTHPTISCLDAIRASCTVPFVCQRYFIGEDEYIDGGILDNFPIYTIPSTEKAIGIDVYVEKKRRKESYLEFVLEIINIPYKIYTKDKKEPENVDIIRIDSNYNSIFCKLTQREVEDMLHLGGTAVMEKYSHVPLEE